MQFPGGNQHQLLFKTVSVLLVVAALFLSTNSSGVDSVKPGGFRYPPPPIEGKSGYFTIAEDGKLIDKKLFVEMGSDGMTIDNLGNIYLTGDGVTVFNKDGVRIEHIPIKQKWTANVSFGGVNQQTLFITASTSLYSLKMKIRGVR